MNCPIDGTQLLISERQGVEIDYCPQCRGVWLDRGELDKLIERSDSFDNRERSKGKKEREEESESRNSSVDIAGVVGEVLKKKVSERNHDRDYPRKKKGGFLGELFDF